MTTQDPTAGQPQPAPKPPILSQQTIGIICGLIIFAGGVAASHGLISQQTADYFASPEATAFIGTLAGAVALGFRAWANRPHGLIQSTNRLSQVDAVIVKPKTASEIDVPGVVGSVDKAAEVVHAARVKHAPAAH